MQNNIPISDAAFSEVLARVAFRLIHMYDFSDPHQATTPRERMLRLQSWLHANGFEALAAFVFRYADDWSLMYRTIDQRDNLIRLARQGRSWRRVAYSPYKATRRDPRVTNRGVTRRPLPEEV